MKQKRLLSLGLVGLIGFFLLCKTSMSLCPMNTPVPSCHKTASQESCPCPASFVELKSEESSSIHFIFIPSGLIPTLKASNSFLITKSYKNQPVFAFDSAARQFTDTVRLTP